MPFDLATFLPYLPWIITGVFGLVILISALFGLKRGTFKATFRFATILGSFLIAFFFAGVVSKLIIDLDVSSISFIHNLAPGFTSVSAYINGYLTSVPEIAELMTSSPAFASLLGQFPLLITNIFVFLLLFYVLRFLTWFFYAIVTSIVVHSRIKKAKAEQKEREVANGIIINYYENTPKQNRGKGMGTLIGLAQGLVLTLVFFLPFSGVVNTYFDVREALEPTQIAEASETSTFETTTIDIDDYIPAEVHQFFVAYKQSAPSIVFSFLKVDRLVFDYVSSITVDGKRIVLSNEIVTAANTYSDIEYFMNIDWENIDLETFDFAKLELVVNDIFDSQIIGIIAPELIQYYGGEYSEIAPTGDVATDKLKLFIPTAIGDITSETLKSDVLAVIRTAKEVQAAGIFGAIKLADAEIAPAVVACLTTENTTNIFNAMLTSQTLRHAIVFGANEAFALLEEEFAIDITELDYDTVVWTNVASSFASFVSNIASNNLLNDYLNNDYLNNVIDLDNPVPADFLGGNYLLADFGKILDIAKANPVFSDSISKVLLSFETDSEVSDYLNVATLASSSYSFETEFACIDNALAHLNNIKDVENKTLIELIIDGTTGYATILDLLNANVVELNAAVDDLMSISIFQSSAERLFTQLTNLVGEQLNVEVSAVDLSNIDWTDEKTKFETILDNALLVIDTIGVESFQGEMNWDAISAHLDEVGEVLDVMKESKLLSGIYTALINYLEANEQVAEFVNFTEINSPSFSWETELGKVGVVIGILDDNNLITGLNSDNYQDLFAQLSEENVGLIVDAIIDSSLLKNSIIAAINELIASLNQTSGLGIAAIPADVDLASQNEQITDVLFAILPIIDSLSGTISIGTLDVTQFGTAMDALENSKVSGGVFSGIYDAIVTYISNDATYGANFTIAYATYPVGQVNWIELLTNVTVS